MPLPTSLGRYLLRAPIGRGGMGAVFRAFDPVLGREVAVKTLTTMEGEAAPDPTDLVRFQREAQAAARLSHPNAIAVYDVGQADGVHFLAMELIDGVG
ncbi:MAG: serine/threonine protein kinase, partial [Planctomycetota bacterium]